MMYSLTHNNHFKFGYNEEWYRSRQNQEDVYTVQFGHCSRTPDSFRYESIEAARLIGNNSYNIQVLYSGGVDSETCMLSFMAARVPFKAAIMRFNSDLNDHDIVYAIRFCERNKVPYIIYDIDIVKFLENKAIDYMEATHCTSPMTAATMWLCDQITARDGYPVLGQGECYLLKPERLRWQRVKEARVSVYQDKEFAVDEWALQESEMMNGWYRHFLLNNINGVPGFHQYTPEQIYSYITDVNVVRLINRQNDSISSNVPSKMEIYQRHFDMCPRPKYTGYEQRKTSELITTLHNHLLEKFSDYQNIYLIDYESLKSQLELQ